MKHVQSFDSFLNESNENLILEYTSYRVSNAEDLLNGLKEIGAPIQIDLKNASVTIDGKNLRAPKNLKDTGTSIKWDDAVMDALRNNKELSAMWKTVNAKYENILKNMKSVESLTGYLGDPKSIDFGTTGPARINDYFQKITQVQKFLNDLLSNANTQKTLREYEILRHLYDRGYGSMLGFK